MNKKLGFSLVLVFVCIITFLCSCASADYTEKKDKYDANGQLSAGQLTAGAYDDNRYYEFWQSLIGGNVNSNVNFRSYNEFYTFRTENRIKISLPFCEYAEVCLLNENQEPLFSAITDKNGVCYLFAPTYQPEYQISIKYYKQGESEPTVEFKTVQGDAIFDMVGVTPCEQLIQIMFVIDVTGSMGDELHYLQSEISDTISQVRRAYNEIAVELSIVVYRDYADAFVVEYKDFSTDIGKQQYFLSNYVAAGGGDFEEAVVDAYSTALDCSWKNSATTKLLFHVADAPAHNEDCAKWNNHVLKFTENGVRIITVASSGIDKRTEYLFRCQSILTQGTYVYLTDESGKGDSPHLEATVHERPVIEYLNSCLVRLIKGYHSGVFDQPVYYLNDKQNYVQ